MLGAFGWLIVHFFNTWGITVSPRLKDGLKLLYMFGAFGRWFDLDGFWDGVCVSRLRSSGAFLPTRIVLVSVSGSPRHRNLLHHCKKRALTDIVGMTGLWLKSPSFRSFHCAVQILLVACYTTLQPAMSVGRSIGWSVPFWAAAPKGSMIYAFTHVGFSPSTIIRYGKCLRRKRLRMEM